MGIIRLSNIVRFFGALVGAIVSALSDGKINFADLPKIFRLIPMAKPAFAASTAEIWDEFRDITQSEREELKGLLAYELDIELQTNHEVNQILEDGLDGALAFVKMVSKIRELKG